MNIIDVEKNFYEGIKDTIVSGLFYGWFDKHVAQRIAKCYGLTRADILNYDFTELGSFDEKPADEIDNVFGLESDYPKEEE
jgi:hypothetical protein